MKADFTGANAPKRVRKETNSEEIGEDYLFVYQAIDRQIARSVAMLTKSGEKLGDLIWFNNPLKLNHLPA